MASGTGQDLVGPHLDVHQWLECLHLEDYKACFNEYAGVEDMLDLTEADIKALGIKNGAHRAQITSCLLRLKAKYDKGNKFKPGATWPGKISNKIINFSENNINLNNGNGYSCVTYSNSNKNNFSQNHSQVTSSNKCNMEPVYDPLASPRQLRKSLEWELSLDIQDLRSHAWYHGTIPRHRAEELVSQDSEFLIRDCISQPGDYVLTCRWKTSPLHFVINKVIVHPNTVYESIQFCLEEDSYDSVPNLVTCYVGSGKTLSTASGAKIARPVNRTMPLSFYATRYGLNYPPSESSRAASPATSICSPPSSPRNSPCTPRKLADVEQTEDDPRRRLVRVGSEPMLSPQIERKQVLRSQMGLFSKSFADAADDPEAPPPPKPSRVPSMRRPEGACRRPIVPSTYYNEPISETEIVVPAAAKSTTASVISETPEYQHESDSGNCSGDSVIGGDLVFVENAMLGSTKRRPQIPLKRRRPASALDRKSTSTDGSLDRDSAFDEDPGNLGPSPTFSLPIEDPASRYDPVGFSTFLLPGDNKPLDAVALAKVKSLLLECGPRILANHLTKVDLEVLRMREGEGDMGLGVTSGIELITLYQGHQLRKDLVERLECLKLFVATMVVTCGNYMDQAVLLDRWIKVAVDTKTALGNLFGFTGIMMGLQSDQVQRLKDAWLYMRRHHTKSALTFETKLRPTLIAMHEGTDPLPPNTSIPHILPLLLILDRPQPELIISKVKTVDEVLHEDHEVPTTPKTPAPVGVEGVDCYPWEHSGVDYGLQLLLAHLTTGRQYVTQVATFKRNAQIALESAKFEELVLDVFRTEFHLRFLWGSKGSVVASSERHLKFNQVLSVLANNTIQASS